MAKVRNAAAVAWRDIPPLEEEVSVTIVHFYRIGAADVDNIVKPILDAMSGVVYVDDRQVVQVTARKSDLTAGIAIRNATPELADAVDQGVDFVYVQIAGPPEHGELP
jgi:hypothetical protein